MLACLPLPQKTPRKQCKPNSGAPTLGIRGDTNISVLSTYTRPMLLEKLISAHLMHVVPVQHFDPGAPLKAAIRSYNKGEWKLSPKYVDPGIQNEDEGEVFDGYNDFHSSDENSGWEDE
ncbi:hypothetical protein BYT27DRAFT_7244552 [Phlegmacium glaucopus]|nr:hypothetical protein BYT27DRAFT_7244552 [Phlegmacium glaucopus]